jgi:lipocalin-like protein
VEERRARRVVRRCARRGPVGVIVDDHDGDTAVEIMAARRSPYREPDPLGGTREERSQAIGTYLSYAGPFEVPADRDVVIHHIEVSSHPNRIGDAQERFATPDGDTLTLSAEPMISQGEERTAELVWERVGRD